MPADLEGRARVLLQPERLNNLASSFVLEARRNPKGLGALEEKRLLAGGYDFPELKDLQEGERDGAPGLGGIAVPGAQRLFPRDRPASHGAVPGLSRADQSEEAAGRGGGDRGWRGLYGERPDGERVRLAGGAAGLYADLHAHSQWQNNARYEVGDGLVCGFRQEAERDGELDFVLCFGPKVGLPVRTLFQGLFESFLARRNLTVMRYEPVRCTNVACGHLLDRSVVRQRMKEGKTFAFCNDCGEKLTLPAMAEPIQLTREVQAEVESQRHAAEQRTRFEQAIFRVHAYVAEQKITPPETFISYAWGVPEHERWVEKRLATDLQKAGINVVLDRWHNAQIGASVARFVERIEKSDRIVMIGTPALPPEVREQGHQYWLRRRGRGRSHQQPSSRHRTTEAKRATTATGR